MKVEQNYTIENKKVTFVGNIGNILIYSSDYGEVLYIVSDEDVVLGKVSLELGMTQGQGTIDSVSCTEI